MMRTIPLLLAFAFLPSRGNASALDQLRAAEAETAGPGAAIWSDNGRAPAITPAAANTPRIPAAAAAFAAPARRTSAVPPLGPKRGSERSGLLTRSIVGGLLAVGGGAAGYHAAGWLGALFGAYFALALGIIVLLALGLA